MEYRRPSSLAPSDHSSIRRRSGGAISNTNSGSHHSRCRTTSQQYSGRNPLLGQTVGTKGDDTIDDQPTVVLVKQSSASHRRLQFAEHLAYDDQSNFASTTCTETNSDSDQRIVLEKTSFTPNPPVLQPASSPDIRPSTSPIPRLPTPDFTTPSYVNAARTLSRRSLRLFTKGLSFITDRSRRPANVLSNTSPCELLSLDKTPRPQSSRSDSSTSTSTSSSIGEGSDQSLLSRGTGSSVDRYRRRQLLVSSLSTSSKFTNKWPKPLSMRNLEKPHNFRRRDQGLGQVAAVLEEGRGLGVDRLDRWNFAKWCLTFSLLTIFAYGAAGLVCAILTWFRTWDRADVMYVADGDILILMTLSGSILLFTALVGMCGTLLNSRPLLAVYTLLLWPAFASILSIGYIAYRRATFSLDRKLNLAWSQYYTALGRLLIQNSLKCCGFYDPLHDATPSKRCYTRTPLPGCKGKLLRFERENLAAVWSAVFAIVPLHILNMVIALLAANHITNVFGKGITPRRYRLRGIDVRADAERLFGLSSWSEGEMPPPVRPVLRPQISTRFPSRGMFREDREDRLHRRVQADGGRPAPSV